MNEAKTNISFMANITMAICSILLTVIATMILGSQSEIKIHLAELRARVVSLEVVQERTYQEVRENRKAISYGTKP